MSGPLAVIAGAGRFPFYVVRAAKQQGLSVVALGIHGWVDPTLAAEVNGYEEVEIGQLGRLVERLKAHRADRVILAGKVTKAVLFDRQGSFDAQAQALLRQAANASVGALLGMLGKRLAAEGITMLDSSMLLREALCPAGVLTARGPTSQEQQDVEAAVQAGRLLTELDIGQTIVAKDGVIVAVEALEGTDATIERAHRLAGAGLVVVKIAGPIHDRRFDLPVVGPETMAVLRKAGVSCLAMEAGATLLFEREALLASANAANLCLVGITLITNDQAPITK